MIFNITDTYLGNKPSHFTVSPNGNAQQVEPVYAVDHYL